MRSPGGILICTSVDGAAVEHDTFTCAHCGAIVRVEHRASPEDMGGRCGVCDKLICPRCVKLGRCDPLEEKLKRAESSYEARRSYGLI